MNHWKRICEGCYENRATGWRIERSCEGGWNVINPETGDVFDNLPTKREAQKIYD